jgi:amidase
MTQIHELTAIELASAIRAKELLPVIIYVKWPSSASRSARFTRSPPNWPSSSPGRPSRRPAADDRRADPDQGPEHGRGRAADVRLAGVREQRPGTGDYAVTRLKATAWSSPARPSPPEFGPPCYTETKIGPRPGPRGTCYRPGPAAARRRSGRGPGPSHPGSDGAGVHPHPKRAAG